MLVLLAVTSDKYLLRVYSVEILLMMDSGPGSNKFKKLCISLAFIIRMRT